MQELDEFKNFDVTEGSLNVWVFRKSQRRDRPSPTFSGHWVDITEELETELKRSIQDARDDITELKQYSILEQNNEGSALTISSLETHAGLLVDAARDETPGKKVTKLKHINNTDFYTIKIVSGKSTLHAVKKTGLSWSTKKAKGFLAATFSDQKLDLDRDPKFSISKYFDFFVLNENILISNKNNFESVLSYKMAHAKQFAELQSESEFFELFDSLVKIKEYVGNNKIQLRRIFAIQQKGHYKDPIFLKALRVEYKNAGLTINFDKNGKIIPCEKTCPDIFQALLDHRLMSLFSKNNYDVPSTSEIA